MSKNKVLLNKFLKLFLFGVISFVCVYSFGIFAKNMGEVAGTITKSFSSIGKLMIATSYMAGIGFAVAAIFKFKQHRDNPTQIPVGTPIALLVIGIILIFLPGIIQPAGETIFGGETETNNAAGGFTGSGATNIPGGSTTGGQ